jgi:DNA invertase Pin-like site-specific DNA recombinase
VTDSLNYATWLVSIRGIWRAAQYERILIQERIVAGLAAARKRGRTRRRPLAITGEKLATIIPALDGGLSKAAVCRNFGVKRTTLIGTLAHVGPTGPRRASSQ